MGFTQAELDTLGMPPSPTKPGAPLETSPLSTAILRNKRAAHTKKIAAEGYCQDQLDAIGIEHNDESWQCQLNSEGFSQAQLDAMGIAASPCSATAPGSEHRCSSSPIATAILRNKRSAQHKRGDKEEEASFGSYPTTPSLSPREVTRQGKSRRPPQNSLLTPSVFNATYILTLAFCAGVAFRVGTSVART
mmetsp:Transcript_9928/g.21822  ORF Transcript_9928/g.21822 Transcript_9928/m.21822 type:complete len:191 (-) Transcript_9928:176-748(-)|eukprot:CAMPEP_0204265432 /NCGR_PEP_ID=MMETSP0468-20130131/9665_1 /ASSEMBLY_ACC=CAM_ASM_000383 /TAXON_ID=2969 /ORGANISM="Oxyrrhis marina" /LENGTH=190 /DNA_ID=CAMNT_0051240379 /DNA_START=58 /DNA_END=630 /DNA_ORIENTATION=+